MASSVILSVTVGSKSRSATHALINLSEQWFHSSLRISRSESTYWVHRLIARLIWSQLTNATLIFRDSTRICGENQLARSHYHYHIIKKIKFNETRPMSNVLPYIPMLVNCVATVNRAKQFERNINDKISAVCILLGECDDVEFIDFFFSIFSIHRAQVNWYINLYRCGKTQCDSMENF